jgi:peroxiredoxin
MNIMPFLRVMLVAYLLVFSISASVAQPNIGQVAPEISLPDPNGQPVSLHSLRGKVVLIDFWASWCGPCRYSNKRISPVYEKYKSAGFEIFAVSLDENLTAWKKAIAADKISWLQVNDNGGWQAKTASKWGIEQIPTSFLLDKEGKIVAIDPSEEKLVSLIGKLLKLP